jgi:hypothetical protein
MASYFSKDSTTIREELEARISILSPMDTPIQALLPTRPVENFVYDWMVDEITTPSTVVVAAEGSSPSPSHVGRVRMTNEAMIVTEAVDITDSERYMNEAGVTDEYAYALAKKHLLAAKQMEYNLHHAVYAARTAGTPQTEGIIPWAMEGGVGRDEGLASVTIAGNTISNVGDLISEGGFTAVWRDFATPMTEAQFNILMGDAWFQGIDINSCILFCGAAVKRAISDFSHAYGDTASVFGNARFNIGQEQRKKVVAVDVYGSDFGELYMALDRYMATAESFATTQGSTQTWTGLANESFFAIDPMFHRVATLRPLGYSPLGKTKDTSDAYVFQECGYQPDNPLAIFGASGVV